MSQVGFRQSMGDTVRIKGTDVTGTVIGLFLDESGGHQVRVRYADSSSEVHEAWVDEDGLTSGL